MSTDNPFAPPSADFNEAASSKYPARKPRSVWVVQILGGFFALGSVAGLALDIYRGIVLQLAAGAGIQFWFLLVWQLLIVVALLLMLWQLPKRSRLGRNLGLGMIALLAAATIFSKHGENSPSVYYTAGQWLATVVIVSILAYWAFAFAFSEKARQYFRAPHHG